MSDPSERCIERVKASMPSGRRNNADALRYIEAAHRAGLICLDCGSDNHTRGHALCRGAAYDEQEGTL